MKQELSFLQCHFPPYLTYGGKWYLFMSIKLSELKLVTYLSVLSQFDKKWILLFFAEFVRHWRPCQSVHTVGPNEIWPEHADGEGSRQPTRGRRKMAATQSSSPPPTSAAGIRPLPAASRYPFWRNNFFVHLDSWRIFQLDKGSFFNKSSLLRVNFVP
jgi:hypothetical protein